MEKVAVITGAAKGLGRKIALFLASEGYYVVVHYKSSQKEAEATLKKIKRVSPKSISLGCDLKSEAEVSTAFSKILGKFRRVDVLINNVGNFLYKKLSETSNEEFRDILESSLYSTLYCSRAVLPIMRKQKSGLIINIGAVGAERFVFRERVIPYFMAKNALYFLTKAMAWEEAKNGIHINMISPASMKTDIFKPRDFPMGRGASYEDVLKVLKFLISKDAYYINGANIEVAGAFIPGMK